MKPCTRIDLNVTWRCNWRCVHCFYWNDDNVNHCHAADVPVDTLYSRIDQAAAAGYNHAVMTGYGEPTLCRDILPVLQHAHDAGLATSIITNGSTGVDRYRNLREIGLDHLHISSHGTGDTLDVITGDSHAWARQQELKKWLHSTGWPYRTNISLQQANYRELMPIIENDLAHGAMHIVLLGFLPHYENARRVCEVAVHPAELRRHVEHAAVRLEGSGVLWTLRYHPLCHLSPEWWPHVTNARHVLYDPWEWNCSLNIQDSARLATDALQLGNSVACEHPCSQCIARRHCGGWNRTYAAAFDGAGLKPIVEVPSQYRDVWDREGGLFDLNPANACTGTLTLA